MKKNCKDLSLKKTLWILCMACGLMLTWSCESKVDHNGDLGGMWQLLEWKKSNGEIVADSAKKIYYSIQLNLIKFKRTGYEDYDFAYFRKTPDSLIIERPVNYSKDSLIRLEDLGHYGVPSDGGFHIDLLNHSHMQLSSTSGRLIFRKY